MAKKTFRSSQKKRNSSSGPKLSGGSKPRKFSPKSRFGKGGGKVNTKTAGVSKSKGSKGFGKGRKTASRKKK